MQTGLGGRRVADSLYPRSVVENAPLRMTSPRKKDHKGGKTREVAQSIPKELTHILFLTSNDEGRIVSRVQGFIKSEMHPEQISARTYLFLDSCAIQHMMIRYYRRAETLRLKERSTHRIHNEKYIHKIMDIRKRRTVAAIGSGSLAKHE